MTTRSRRSNSHSTPKMVSTRYQHNNMTQSMAALAIVFTIVLATAHTTNAQEPSTRVKRMYTMCPPHFEGIGNQCYYVSDTPLNWLESHFACKDRNSRLAEPIKLEDRRLRKYMQRSDRLHTPKWIGGLYNWQKNKWQWGYSGRDMDYQSFSQMVPGSSQDLKFHCAVLNSDLKYRWSARSCVERHHFVCQHKMPYVSEKNRYKVYSKWNESFPNEMANEVEVVLNQPRDRRRLSPSQILESHNKLDQTIKDPSHYNTRTELKPVPRKRKVVLFDNEISNGRIPSSASKRVDFGAPRRENNRMRPRRKHRTSTTTTTTTSTTAQPAIAQQEDNNLDVGPQQLEQERARERQRQLNAERKAKHLKRQEERRRRNQERRRQQDAERHHQVATTTTTTTEAPQPPTTELTEEQRREQERLAESRRLLGIDRSNGLDNFYNAPPTFASSAATRTTTTETPLTTTRSPTTAFDERRQMAEEQRIRDEERRQELEYEQQMIEYKRKQEEADREEQRIAEQLERKRQQEMEERDRLEQKRLIEARRIEEEDRERENLRKEQEEERARLEEEKRTREEARQRQAEEVRRQKAESLAELQRLKEKSAANRENETGAFEDSAEADRKRLEEANQERERQMKALKKAKYEKLMGRLQKLSPEKQLEFLRLRQEKNNSKKREAHAAIPEQ